MLLDSIRLVGIECMSLYVSIFVFILLEFVRLSTVIELKERGYLLVSAANRGGEGFDTNGTQKTTVGKFGRDFPTVVYILVSLFS